MKKSMIPISLLALVMAWGAWAQPDQSDCQSILQSDIQIRTDTIALDSAVNQLEDLQNNSWVYTSQTGDVITESSDKIKYLNNLIYAAQQTLANDVSNQTQVAEEANIGAPTTFTATTN